MITAFPGKLKDVLHSQEDGANIFTIQLHNMSELCAFHREYPSFQKIFKVIKKFSPLHGDNDHFAKKFTITSPIKSISSCQQGIKVNQFSQQNTHCRTAFLQNSSLGAPIRSLTLSHLGGGGADSAPL